MTWLGIWSAIALLDTNPVPIVEPVAHPLLALQRAHHHQQLQQHARSGASVLSNPNLKPSPVDRPTPSIMELDRQIASSDSGQNRNSPANSTAAGSSLQVGCMPVYICTLFLPFRPLLHGSLCCLLC